MATETCQGITATGDRCRKFPKKGTGGTYCHLHLDQRCVRPSSLQSPPSSGFQKGAFFAYIWLIYGGVRDLHESEIAPFLLIEGIDLWSAVYNAVMGSEELLLDITFKVIRLAAHLERREFYHEDLKCTNIVQRHADGELFFIDFGGGLTRGMYRAERESLLLSQGPDATDALFTLGRTLWELWAADSSWEGGPLNRVQNDTVRHIIRDCEQGKVDSIVQLSEKYSPGEMVGRQ
jgi:hypothetical protein